MLHFSKVLHVENRGFLYFSFKCSNSPGNKKCGVQVWTEGEQCHDFVMEEKNGAWRITPTTLPQWIVELEAPLQTVICEYQLKTPAAPSRFRIAHYGKTGS